MTTKTPRKSCVSCYTYDDTIKASIATPCCARFVCGACVRKNQRLAETCILCQLPIPQDLAETVALPVYEETLPPYNDDDHHHHNIDDKHRTKKERLEASGSAGYKEVGVQHFVRPTDSVASLSLAYRVPATRIRQSNHLFSDALIQARAFIVIPGARVSLSASPGEGEVNKVKLKQFMVSVKCTDYDMAKTYMEECDYQVSRAVSQYQADSQWTRTHAKQTSHAGTSRGTTR